MSAVNSADSNCDSWSVGIMLGASKWEIEVAQNASATPACTCLTMCDSLVTMEEVQLYQDERSENGSHEWETLKDHYSYGKRFWNADSAPKCDSTAE